MGLFEDIGRKVGKISHEAKEATREQATATCGDCETLVYSDRDTCPDCGSDNLVRVESEAGDADPGDSAAADPGASKSEAEDSGSAEPDPGESAQTTPGVTDSESTLSESGDSGSGHSPADTSPDS